MQAYSVDLRERVVAAYQNGVDTIPDVAAQFSVSQSFVKKMLAQKRATGSVAPRSRGGGQPKRLSAKERRWLLAAVRKQPDATLAELQTQLFAEHNKQASLPTLCRELAAARLRRKKSRAAPASKTSENARGIGGG